MKKVNHSMLNNSEKEIEENIDKTYPYPPAIKEQKIKMLTEAAKAHVKKIKTKLKEMSEQV
jgi:hypothetical protein